MEVHAINLKNTLFYKSLTYLNKKSFYRLFLIQAFFAASLCLLIVFATRIILPIFVRMLDISQKIKSETLQQIEVASYVNLLKDNLSIFIISVVILFAILVFVYSFFKFYFWKHKLNRKWSWRAFLIFLLSNTILSAIFIFLFYGLMLLAPQEYRSVLFIFLFYPLFALITSLFHYFFAKTYSLANSALLTKEFLLRWLYKFLLPGLILILPYLMFILNIMFVITKIFKEMQAPQLIPFLIFTILYILFTTWVKHYFALIVEKNQQNL